MTMMNWFNTKEVDEFAQALAKDLTGRLPPSKGSTESAYTPARLNSTRDAIHARATAFARTHKINWYKKAHLANTFKWALHEARYDSKFVDSWTYDLMVFVSAKPKSATPVA